MSNQNHISLSGKDIPIKHEKIDIFNLKFYPENPRIASIIDKSKDKSETFIDNELWNRNETHDLKRRIERHGGLIHEIIVWKGHVLEGNTRLCCFRHLYNEYEDDKWKKIDCTVIIGDITKKEINSLLADEHIIGKIKWNTYEKGCWMTMMKERENYEWDELEKIVGKSRAWIETHIDAYKMMVKRNVEEKAKFSHFLQAIPVIKKLKNKDPQIENKLVKAIKNEQFEDAKDLRKVPVLFSDKKSRKRLFDDGEKCGQVYIDLKAKSPSVDTPLMRSIEDTTKRLENMSRLERESIRDDKRELDKIKKLAKEVVKLCRELQLNIYNLCK